MTDWQPIETAPRDGTSVLLAWRGSVDHGWYVNLDSENAESYWVYSCEGFRAIEEPTHWMPWPEPPKP